MILGNLHLLAPYHLRYFSESSSFDRFYQIFALSLNPLDAKARRPNNSLTHAIRCRRRQKACSRSINIRMLCKYTVYVTEKLQAENISELLSWDWALTIFSLRRATGRQRRRDLPPRVRQLRDLNERLDKTFKLNYTLFAGCAKKNTGNLYAVFRTLSLPPGRSIRGRNGGPLNRSTRIAWHLRDWLRR